MFSNFTLFIQMKFQNLSLLYNGISISLTLLVQWLLSLWSWSSDHTSASYLSLPIKWASILKCMICSIPLLFSDILFIYLWSNYKKLCVDFQILVLEEQERAVFLFGFWWGLSVWSWTSHLNSLWSDI